MKKVLIITYYFPPINIISSRRYGEMAPYMPKFGWEPIVLTTHSEGNLPLRINAENIIRIGENCDSGKVLVAQEGSKGIPFLIKPFYALSKKLGMEIKSADRFLFSWGREVLKHTAQIEKINPDVIVASYQPATAMWLGHLLARRLKKPWVMDFREAASPYNTCKSSLAKFVDKKIDRYLLRTASAIVTVSPQLASLLEAFYERPVGVVFNGFDIPQSALAKNTLRRAKKQIVLYYAGRFHPHRIAPVKLLIDWLSLAKNQQAIFVARSMGPKESNEKILLYAKRKGVADKIQLRDPASPELILQEEKKADALLVCEDIGKASHISQTNVTGKLFEYVPFKAPILAIAREDSEIGEILADTGRGFLAWNLDTLGQRMEKIMNDDIPVRKQARVNDYSRKSQCKKLCAILDDVFEASRR